MEIEKFSFCSEKAKGIFNKIIEGTDLSELAHDFWKNRGTGIFDYKIPCCFEDISSEGNGEIVVHRFKIYRISDNNKYYECSGCGTKGTIINWYRNFMDVSLVETFEFLDEYFQLDLYNITDLDNSIKFIIINNIRDLNRKYIESECPDIHEISKIVFSDEDPFASIQK
ncbi:hypothetical protein [Halanaerobium hydrogeniformans]|uniref:Uncharacterized protein n=1 Tax=Halanaerobium hydrogeniformans TaxID=656519 RepID=E4RN97_HALHG|nr:hypothetical protein [Halanaerobium hydrogeniformans]ADQ13565.1 hypothetical protein Halsa_0069 [Halanaerobium hydrogeniformans]